MDESKEWKLFLVVLGGYARNCHVELLDVRHDWTLHEIQELLELPLMDSKRFSPQSNLAGLTNLGMP